jgi:beta-mannanase
MALVTFGVYDPSGAFAGKPGIGIDHYFTSDWNLPATGLTALCNASRSAGRVPLVTIPPFHDSKITRNAVNTLSDIAAGKYDANIRNYAAALNAYNGPVFIRWGAEMDDPSNFGKFDWAVPPEQAGQYISAYQRFYSVFSSYTNHLTGKSFLWSPVWGERSSVYWPGNSFADYVGCSLYVWKRYVAQFYLQTDDSFALLFGQRYAKLSVYGKSIIIAEMGYEAADDQASWITAMKASLGNFPLLSAAVWSNSRDVYPYVPGGPIPDWTVSPSLWHNP